MPGPTGTRFLDQRQVVLVRGERNYVRLDLGGRTVLLRGTLQDMAQRLSPDEFVRVNRSVIVRIAAVAELRTLPHGEVALQLTTGEQVVSGRAHAAHVKAALGL